MNVKRESIDDLNKRFTVPQGLVLQILIDIIPWDEFWPVLTLLYQELRFHSNFVEGKYTLCYAKATVTSHYLPHPMD